MENKSRNFRIISSVVCSYVIFFFILPKICTAEKDKAAAIVLGREIFAGDCDPNETLFKEKQNQLTEKQFAYWLKQYKGSLLTNFVLKPLLQEYADSNDFDPNQEELNECQRALVRIDTLNNSQIQILTDIRKELEYPDIDECWRKNVEYAIKDLERLIKILKSHKSAEEEIRLWKANKTLYETYGGRVTHAEAGYVPFDGYREFLIKQQKLGKFVLTNENTAKLFWDYYSEYNGPFLSSDITFNISMPWWRKYVPEDMYEEQLKFINATPEELITYLLDRWKKQRLDTIKYSFVWFIARTHDEYGQRLRKEFAERIVNELQKFKEKHGDLHDCSLLAEYLGPLGAREQTIELLKKEKRFSCHYGPQLVESLGQCGTIEDVPFLIDCIDKESDGSDAAVNKALQMLTGIQMPLKNYRTDKEAWQKWWEEYNKKIDTVRWVDTTSGEEFFNINDIVRFDWDKQIFELRKDKVIYLKSPGKNFSIKIGEETLYTGAFVSIVCSASIPGPVIVIGNPEVKPPLFKIDNGYPEHLYKDANDIRFSEKFKNALAKYGKLAEIDEITTNQTNVNR